MRARLATAADLEQLADLRSRLWTHLSREQHRAELVRVLRGEPSGGMPQAAFVVEQDGRLIGFAEADLRSHADGCDPSRPCGYLEGWYVDPACQRRGVGRVLVEAVEAWCRELGCTELASDTWADNDTGRRAHEALGFELVDCCANYRKSLATAEQASQAPPYYGRELARIHHDHFGMVARAAAGELLERLAARGVGSGTVVDLAVGSGILSQRVTAAGFRAWGVDIAPAMLAIARAQVPEATFVHGSLWSAELPSCVAVAAIGEPFNYATDAAVGMDALAERFAAVHRALAPGGLLLFDIAGPGRSGPGGQRRNFWAYASGAIGVDEREESPTRLTRAITIFVPAGGLYRRIDETHVLHLYDPDAVEGLLARVGFRVERLARYGDFVFPAGWAAFAASK